MKTKNFQDYLEKRLDADEITKIEEQAKLEAQNPQSLQSRLPSFTRNSEKIKEKK